MKSLKKQSLIIAVILIFALLLTACGSSHTCTDCGRGFRGNAYQGIFSSTLMCRPCALDYWHPMTDISNFRIR